MMNPRTSSNPEYRRHYEFGIAPIRFKRLNLESQDRLDFHPRRCDVSRPFQFVHGQCRGEPS